MASLTTGVQRYGTNYLATVFACTSSAFDVAGTAIYILDATGGLKSWASGRASFLNNLGGTNKDEIPPYTAFLVLPGASITTDDTKLSFGTAIASGSGKYFGQMFA
jgi:hypothetical protein